MPFPDRNAIEYADFITARGVFSAALAIFPHIKKYISDCILPSNEQKAVAVSYRWVAMVTVLASYNSAAIKQAGPGIDSNIVLVYYELTNKALYYMTH